MGWGVESVKGALKMGSKELFNFLIRVEGVVKSA